MTNKEKEALEATVEGTEATEEAKEKAKEKAKPVDTEKKRKEEEAKRKAYMEELVPFYAFKDNDKYKDDIFVAVNGETCQIQRGKQVMIKRKFYNVLKRGQAQDTKAADLMAEQNSRYKNAAGHLN